jgi:hypothetical protein
MKTIVYVDGFNLYYRGLKPWNTRWLDLELFFARSLPEGHELVAVKYFTAEVDPFLEVEAPVRQRIYLAALRHYCSKVQTIKGMYAVYPSSAHLVRPHGPEFTRYFVKRRRALSALDLELAQRGQPFPNPALGEKVHVWRPEEKGSDVNLAAHLVNDAWKKAAECYVVATIDSDLCEALRIVRDDVGSRVGLMTPEGSGSKSLVHCATWHEKLRESVARVSQLPDKIPDTEIVKPEKW